MTDLEYFGAAQAILFEGGADAVKCGIEREADASDEFLTVTWWRGTEWWDKSFRRGHPADEQMKGIALEDFRREAKASG